MKKIILLLVILIVLVGCSDKETDKEQQPITGMTVLPLDRCITSTCAQLEKECDSWNDGCDGRLDCGKCAEGKTCLGGKCVIVPTTICTDTDANDDYPNGKNPLEKGGIIETGKDGLLTKKIDECVSLSEVEEYFCIADLGYKTTMRCPKDTVCGDGKCISGCLPTTCSDLEKNCGKWSDNCNKTLDCGKCMLGQQCLLGKCVSDKICTDTDGGKNYRARGDTYSSKDVDSATYTDMCSGDKLLEYYCDADNLVADELALCPDGCSNGVCS